MIIRIYFKIFAAFVSLHWISTLGSGLSVDSSEFDALHDFYISTNGVDWNIKNVSAGAVWNFSSPTPNPCDPLWQGLTCRCDTSCAVTEISLPAANLTGSIPLSIGNFTALESLLLNGNRIGGTIPTTIGSLRVLVTLDLRFNGGIHGPLPPSIVGLQGIQSLLLSNNALSGPLIPELFQLTSLQFLSLGYNKFTGTVPAVIGNLVNLDTFHLISNFLTGQLPPTIGNLSSIVKLSLTGNLLNGSVPSEVCQLATMKILSLGSNALHGSIPDCFDRLTSLEEVFLNSNELTGTVPASLCLPSLVRLELYSNHLVGSLPPRLFNTTNSSLVTINMRNNSLTGPLPDISLPQLYIFIISNNLLSGTLAPTISRCFSLFYVDLSINQMTGPVPPLVSLHALSLNGNAFTGPLPTFNAIYFVNDNLFTGTIDSSVCNNVNEYFDIEFNLIHGTVPDCIGQPHLRYFSVGSNLMSGTVPSSFEQTRRLETFVVNNNSFTSALPSFAASRPLMFLYVQNNHFTGPLSLSANQSALQYVDVGYNQFTGTLPVDYFTTTSILKSFSATSNCLTGSIPESICRAAEVIFLDLDGLTTASSCRTAIFPGIPGLDSYYLHKQISGGVPECLFRMPALQTLHLSGNNIVWSFPDDLTIGANLTTLSLSHNRLTGTIPAAVQSRAWSTIDLSFNRLGGSLASFTAQNAVNSSVVLQVNRLSGPVPDSLVNLQNINILSGNLFGCDWQRNGLPTHDVNYQIYQCGSNALNEAAYIWLACLSAWVVLLVGVWVCRKRFWSWWLAARGRVESCFAVFADAPDNHRLHQFKKFILTIRNVVLAITTAIVVLMLPVYSTLTELFRSVEYQYAWTISAAFLSGLEPAVVLFLLFCGLVGSLTYWFAVTVATTKKRSDCEQSEVTWQQTLALLAVVLADALVLTVVNAGYVAVILESNAVVIFVVQVVVATFKLLWNEFALTGMVRVARRFYHHQRRKCDVSQLIREEMPYLTFSVLFNCILAPCLATAVVDTNCFFNVFRAPAAVSTEFPESNEQLYCAYDAEAYRVECSVTNTGRDREVSYDPPFIYNYQCSSSILINYASMYVLMYLILGFVKPAVLALLARWCTVTTPLVDCSLCLRAVVLVTPVLLKPANEEDLRNEWPLYDRERIVLRTLAKLVVFFTFGVVFPLLAAVICVAFVTEAYVQLLVMGRFLVSIEDAERRQRFRGRISRECEGCMDLLLGPLGRLVVPFAALFYSLFIFDIYGDAVGFRRAVWAPVLLVSTPWLVWLALGGRAWWAGGWRGGEGGDGAKSRQSERHTLSSLRRTETSRRTEGQEASSDVELSETVSVVHRDTQVCVA